MLLRILKKNQIRILKKNQRKKKRILFWEKIEEERTDLPLIKNLEVAEIAEEISPGFYRGPEPLTRNYQPFVLLSL